MKTDLVPREFLERFLGHCRRRGGEHISLYPPPACSGTHDSDAHWPGSRVRRMPAADAPHCSAHDAASESPIVGRAKADAMETMPWPVGPNGSLSARRYGFRVPGAKPAWSLIR